MVVSIRARGGIRAQGSTTVFGFDSGEEDELEPTLTLSSGPQSGAFRVGEKLSIKGEIVGEGDLELAGRFEGIVNVNGRVTVGERAEVDADISASNIVVAGKVRGNLNATGRVEILPQGVLTGNLKSGSFGAADGALVKGEIVVTRRGRSRSGEVGHESCAGGAVAVLAWAPAWAGELIFANGNRMAGDLSNEALMVSTGSGLVEIGPMRWSRSRRRRSACGTGA